MDTWILLLGIALAVVTAGALYFLPTIIAARQNSHLTAAIAVVNFAFGWTVFGWIIALIMALIPPRRPYGT